MKLPIVFRAHARLEYDRSARWYNRERAGLEIEFTEEVERVLLSISTQPNRFPVVIRDIREAAVKRFPYCVYYRVRSGRIIVLSVFHQSRDPIEWQTRN